jgi:hypothetical protein
MTEMFVEFKNYFIVGTYVHNIEKMYLFFAAWHFQMSRLI